MANATDRHEGWRAPREMMALLALFALYLLPAARTGYFAEDLIHSMTPGIARLEGISPSGQFLAALRGNLALGRFYPVTQLLHVGVHALARDALTYKVALIAGTVLDLALFYLLVRRLTGNVGFACLASCLTIGLVQFRVHPDPVLGYYLQVQLVAAGLFFSLYALQLHLEGRGRPWLAVSAGAYLLIAMTYEVTYPFFAAHLLLIWRGRDRWEDRLVAALPTLGVVLACGMATIMVRRLSQSQDHYVHDADFRAGEYLMAIWHQASAALPMSYRLGDPHSIFAGPGEVAGLGALARGPMAVIVALAGLGLSYKALRRPDAADGRLARWSPTTAGLGLMLVLLPTVLIALSPLHRSQFRFGVGWVPVLIQCHGMGLVLATLAWWALSCRPLGGTFAARKCAVVATIIAAVMGLTYRANEQVADCLNAPKFSRDFRAQATLHGGQFDQRRRLLEAALTSGLMDDVPERSVVRLAHEYPLWQDPISSLFFYATYASKVLVSEVPSAQEPGSRAGRLVRQFLDAHAIVPRPGLPYQLREVSLGRQAGYVVLWRPDGPGPGRPGEFRIYVRHPGLFDGSKSPNFRVLADLKAPGAGPGLAGVVRHGRDLAAIRSGRGWGLYALRGWTGRVGPDGVRVAFDAR